LSPHFPYTTLFRSRIVQAGVLVPAGLEVLNAPGGVFDHLLLGAEHDRLGRAGLHAGRFLPHRHPVRAQGALVDPVVLLGQARDVERAAGDAVAAADAVFLVEIHDAVVVLHDRARCRAGLQAARVLAVHAAVLADQPLQRALVGLALGEAHQGPGLRGEVVRVVVDAGVLPDAVAQVVPLHARHLAGLAADAPGGVDQLGHPAAHGGVGARGGRLHGGGGDPAD